MQIRERAAFEGKLHNRLSRYGRFLFLQFRYPNDRSKSVFLLATVISLQESSAARHLDRPTMTINEDEEALLPPLYSHYVNKIVPHLMEKAHRRYDVIY